MRDNTKTHIKIGLVVALFLTIGLYSYFKTKSLFQGVDLQVTGLYDGKASTPLVHIHGVAKNATYIAINDRPIFIESDGDYTESLLLLPGYNIITIQARDKFNNQSEKVYKLTLN